VRVWEYYDEMLRYLKNNILLICRSFVDTVRRLVLLKNGSETI